MLQLSQVLPCLDKNSPSPERRLLKGVCLELKAERKVSRLSYGGALLELLWASLHIHEGDEDYAVTRLAVLMNNSFEPTFQLLCSYFNDNKLHVQLVRGNASLESFGKTSYHLARIIEVTNGNVSERKLVFGCGHAALG